jgi:prevent-host-death family protein
VENILSAKEAKTHFGMLLDMAQRQPVTVEKNGRPVAVVLSLHDYSQFEKMEDELLALKAGQAAKSGWVNKKKSAEFLAKLDNRKNKLTRKEKI